MVADFELVFDAKWLNPEESFLHTLPLLAKSALKIYEYSHPTSYVQLCDMLTQRCSDKHDRFHKSPSWWHRARGDWMNIWKGSWSSKHRSPI